MNENIIKIPNHVALIVDGNGRWAVNQGLNRSDGHKAGFENLKKITKYIFEQKTTCVSAYLFSTENFKRSKTEVNYIMNLLVDKLNDILAFCHEEKIKAVFSGRRDNLSKKVIATMNKIVEDTKCYENKIFNICFGYGAHAEIVDGVKSIIKDIKLNKITEKDIDEKLFSEYLYQHLPPVDLLIRTGGELRLSNFMLWQCAYAEFYFTKTYFPDLSKEDYDEILLEYTKRDRRFGGIKDEN